MEKKTHRAIKTPRISVRVLADYMAASEVSRRTIVRDCKYRSIARNVQHEDARLGLTTYFKGGSTGVSDLLERADFVRGKLTDTDFEKFTNEVNADYLVRFAQVAHKVALPSADLMAARRYEPILVEGVELKFQPELTLQRTTKTNKVRRGAIMLRYAKGKALAPKIGCYQSAAMLGFLAEAEKGENSEPERGLCLTVDAYEGIVYEAPSDSISVFKNMRAACATIAERWEKIEPPKGAVL